MSKQIKNAKTVQNKSRTHEVTFNFVNATGAAQYTVQSGTSGRKYVVRIHGDAATCTCKWGGYKEHNDRRSGCSHVTAVFSHIARENGSDRNVSVWTNEADADRQHRPMMDIGDNVILTAVVTTAKQVFVQDEYDDDYSEFEKFGPIFAKA